MGDYMGRTEAMVETVESLMSNRENIRNIGTVAHIDHGKTTLSDSLIAAAGLINSVLAGEMQCGLNKYVAQIGLKRRV